MGIATITREELPKGVIYFVTGKWQNGDKIHYRHLDLESAEKYCKENHIFYTIKDKSYFGF